MMIDSSIALQPWYQILLSWHCLLIHLTMSVMSLCNRL